MKNIMETILHRRSIRRYSARPVEEEALQQILTAGLYAPSAGGRQGPLFAVSEDREVNLTLGKLKRAAANPVMAKNEHFVSKDQPSIADDPNLKDSFYGAPVVITFFGPKNFLFAAEDCAMAAENMMLTADALGIGSCYIGQGWQAFSTPYGQQILKRWGVPATHYAVAQLLLGCPLEGDPHPAPKPRKEGRILRY